MRRKLPKTKEECFKILAEEEKDCPLEIVTFGYHMTLGLFVRNAWIYGKGDKVTRLFGADNDQRAVFADGLSEDIIDEYREYKRRVRMRAAVDRMEKKLPEYFDEVGFHLSNYKKQKGLLRVDVEGTYDHSYEYKFGIYQIKKCYQWLEKILKTSGREQCEFSFFDYDSRTDKVFGYIPMSDSDKTFIDEDQHEFPLNDCGLFYIIDDHYNTVLVAAFVHYENLVRSIYTSIKRCKQLKAQSKKVMSHFLEKNDIVVEHDGIKCIGKVSPADLLYHGEFYNEDNTPIENWAVNSDNDCAFRDLAEGCIEQILHHREEQRKNEEWKKSISYESVRCIFGLKPQATYDLVKQGKFDRSLIETVKGGEYKVPLTYVTKAWEYILKGSLCDFEYAVADSDEKEKRSKRNALYQVFQIKTLWKRFLGVDIDTIEVDFSKFNKHLPPNVSEEESRQYFGDPVNGIEEWMINVINSYDAECSYDSVSALMEYAAYLSTKRAPWDESYEL